MAGPPITVSCLCGTTGKVAYGTSWVCPSCGRRWDTSQIPAEAYQGILRDMRRARLLVIGVAVGVTAVFGLLALFVSESLFLLAPVLITGWFIVYMPLWRRRLRRRARSVPTWELTPD